MDNNLLLELVSFVFYLAVACWALYEGGKLVRRSAWRVVAGVASAVLAVVAFVNLFVK